MVVKTYEAKNTIISRLTVFIEGRPYNVNFTPVSRYCGSHTGRGSMFTTADEKLQNALESHRTFGREYSLFKTELIGEEPIKDVEKESQEVEQDVKHIPVSTPAEAREYLVENFGYSAKGLTRIDRISKAALEHNIVFDYE